MMQQLPELSGIALEPGPPGQVALVLSGPEGSPPLKVFLDYKFAHDLGYAIMEAAFALATAPQPERPTAPAIIIPPPRAPIPLRAGNRAQRRGWT